MNRYDNSSEAEPERIIFRNENLQIFSLSEAYKNIVFLSHLEIVKDVTKKSLRRNLIKTR